MKTKLLNNNQLKILAVIAMTCDHIGKQLLPEVTILQIFGRLAFPIFVYMIAEGCRYTRNRKRYILSMASLAFVCQVVYYVAMQSLYMCVLVTFSMSIALIYAMDNAIRRKNASGYAVFLLTFAVIFILSEILPKATDAGFDVDYGFWGIMRPYSYS